MDLRALLGYRRMKKEADELVHRGTAIHQLQYDDLVRDPETALTAICEFIGVPFDSRMTSLEGADRSAIYNGEHHSMVKSSSIEAKRNRPEVLSPALKRKVERYVVFWNNSLAALGQSTLQSIMERSRFLVRTNGESYSHGALRALNCAIPYVYSLVPVSVWQRYRQVKSRYQRIAPKPTRSEDVS